MIYDQDEYMPNSVQLSIKEFLGIRDTEVGIVVIIYGKLSIYKNDRKHGKVKHAILQRFIKCVHVNSISRNRICGLISGHFVKC